MASVRERKPAPAAPKERDCRLAAAAGFRRADLVQFRMIGQELPDGLLDQGLNRGSAQDRGELELPVAGFGNARFQLDPGFGVMRRRAGGRCGQLLVAGFQADRIGLQGPGIADFGALA
jgi:hypothetical protein